MTTKLEQAARQALDAIGDCSPNKALVHAAHALRKALEQPVSQEPVSYVGQLDDEVIQHLQDKGYNHSTPLYAAPVRTKDLTDDEIEKAFWGNGDTEIEGCRAVIAADREKNNANNNT